MKLEKNKKTLNEKRMRTARAHVTRIQKKIKSVAPEREVSTPLMVGKWQTTDELVANQSEGVTTV